MPILPTMIIWLVVRFTRKSNLKNQYKTLSTLDNPPVLTPPPFKNTVAVYHIQYYT